MPPIIRIAKLMMEQYRLVAVPNDKDPGYMVMSVQHFQLALQEVLQNTHYQHLGHYRLPCQHLQQQYFKFCRQAGEYDDCERQGQHLKRSALQPSASMVSSLVLFGKSHKPNGKISFRDVHTAPGYAFAGLSLWIAEEFRSVLRSLPHIVPSSAHFVRKLDGITLGTFDRMLRIAIRHFYLSGTPDQLTENACNILPGGPRAQFTGKVLRWLLEEQYLRCTDLPQHIWRVVKGSGQGLPHSGPVANSAFYSAVEKNLVSNRSIMDAHGMSSYFRFEDDIFLVSRRSAGPATDGSANARNFLQMMRHRAAGLFEIQLEQSSCTSVTMLAVEVFRTASGALGTRPKLKLRGQPLDNSSAHPPHVHSSWPVALLRSQYDLCMSHDEGCTAETALINHFRTCHAPRTLIQLLESKKKSQQTGRHRTETRQCDGQMWLTVPYHAALQSNKALQKCLDNINGCPLQQLRFHAAFGRSAPNLRLAWRNSGQHSVIQIRKLTTRINSNWSVHGEDGGNECV